MPFNNVIISVTRQYAYNLKFSLEKDTITAVCAQEGILLESSLIINDNRQHSFEWEQVYGPVVEFATSRFAEFTNVLLSTLDQGDVIVRFWVDRHTKYQQYKDVVIYRTPTEQTTVSFLDDSVNPQNSFVQYGSTDRTKMVPCDSVYFIPLSSAPYNENDTGASYTDDQFLMYWGNPEDSSTLVGFIIEESSNGVTWAETAQVLGNSPIPVRVGKNYRITAVHTIEIDSFTNAFDLHGETNLHNPRFTLVPSNCRIYIESKKVLTGVDAQGVPTITPVTNEYDLSALSTSYSISVSNQSINDYQFVDWLLLAINPDTVPVLGLDSVNRLSIGEKSVTDYNFLDWKLVSIDGSIEPTLAIDLIYGTLSASPISITSYSVVGGAQVGGQ